MKHLLLGLLMLPFSSFAQEYVRCNFKVEDNKVKCGFLKLCPEKELKKTEHELLLEFNSGVPVSENITLKRVLLHPENEKREQKSLVYLFESDNRDEVLSEEKDINIKSWNINEQLKLDGVKIGNEITIKLVNSIYKQDFKFINNFSGTLNASVPMRLHYLDKGQYPSQVIKNVLVSCRKIPAEVVSESEIRKQLNADLELEQKQRQAIAE
jgi:hypothetical protein